MIEMLNEDCMDVMACYPDNHFDLAIVDPPYNVGFNYSEYQDNKDCEQYKVWCESWLSELLRITSDFVSISCGIKNIAMWHSILEPKWVACWHKPACMGRSAIGFNNWEPILIYKCKGSSNDVFVAPIVPSKEMDFHPCPKPLRWATEQIRKYGKGCVSMFDPFAGSFTTAIAADKFGMDYVGVELDKDYYEAAVKRFKNHEAQGQLFKPTPTSPDKQSELKL